MVTENTEPQGEETAQSHPTETSAPESTSQDRTFSQEDVNRIQAQTRREIRNQFSDYNQLSSPPPQIGRAHV